MLLASHHHRYSSRSRRGIGSLLSMVFLTIFIMLLVLVLNYVYLAYSQLRTGEVTDTLARIAASELLDEDLLAVGGDVDQVDDVAFARSRVDEYVEKLNAVSPTNQQLRYVPGSADPLVTDIYVTPGWVQDVGQPVTDGNRAAATFKTTAPQDTPFNTLKVEASRPVNGGNPLYMFVRAAFAPTAAQIGTKSFVSLDSRVIGFQPTETISVPIAPIALNVTEWANRPSNTNVFSGQLNDGANSGNNMVLLNFKETGTFDISPIADLIYHGAGQADIVIDDNDPQTPSYFLGPVVEDAGLTLDLLAEESTPNAANGQAIADALQDVADGTNPRRIFPLYDPGQPNNGSDTVTIVGFVAGEIMSADYDNVNERLTVELRPQFVIHPTVMTRFEVVDGANVVEVPENVYIHKLRLSR